MKNVLITLSVSWFIAACASAPPPNYEIPVEDVPEETTTETALERTEQGIGDAALSPLEDVNLKRDKIPEKFNEIKNPYLVHPEVTCEVIAKEVLSLDELLGRDWDIPPPDKKGMSERAADGASTAFLDAVASGASGLIPYRGLVRTVTGANSHATKVRKAYERGSHRRTFLKGIGMAKGCEYPASPLPPQEEEPKILFR
ncbi:MAG: hypothetical protein VXW22_14070 [Pseudomonadota bacterium]|jgi:hypothetical protein|nr:hypothetical protein [Pseudomonadota bacterium]